ncbi:MAG: hypothetical protein LBQ75_02260 [Zoogloeaceae bacterium]|jgi:hypothetical protein|nr:hypothetical protein [Zoogloeaceae bacterium]
MKLKPLAFEFPNSSFRFTNGIAALGDLLYFSGVLDDADEEDSLHIIYDELASDQWEFMKLEHWVTVALVRFVGPKPFMCVMTQEGNVILRRVGEGAGDENYMEKIPGAGLNWEDSVGYGYMTQLRQIGKHLYACGTSGQVYKHTGLYKWAHMDKGILGKPGDEVFWIPNDINGPHESAIYLAGSISTTGLPPFLAFWNGKVWRKVAVPEVAGYFTRIFAESESRIWLCGDNGTLLLGNADDGFKSLSSVEDNQLFTSITMFNGMVYLGSNLGPFVYDPNQPDDGIRPLKTTLNPPLKDVHSVDAKDGVLWMIGSKDLARFDGTDWQRIEIPVKPKIWYTP